MNSTRHKIFIIISAMGYEKIVKVKPVDSNTPPTKILKQGENKLVVKVIDDINAPVKDAFVKVINEEVNLEMDLQDQKSLIERIHLTNLPKGNYKVIATSKTLVEKHELVWM